MGANVWWRYSRCTTDKLHTEQQKTSPYHQIGILHNKLVAREIIATRRMTNRDVVPPSITTCLTRQLWIQPRLLIQPWFSLAESVIADAQRTLHSDFGLR